MRADGAYIVCPPGSVRSEDAGSEKHFPVPPESRVVSPADSPSTRPDEHGLRPARRRFLAGVGAAATAGLAGCGSLRSDDPAAFHGGDWHSYGNGPENRNRVAGGAPEPDEQAPQIGRAHV